MRKKVRKRIMGICCLSILLIVVAVTVLSGGWQSIERYEVLSGYYNVDEDKMLISGIAPGESEDALIKRLYCDKTLLLSDGVKTGSVISNGTYSYALAVEGDLNGDGVSDEADKEILQSSISGEAKLNEAQILAADVNGDGTVNEADVEKLEKYIEGVGFLKAATPENTRRTFYVMQKGETTIIPIEARNNTEIISGDESIAAVGDSGIVTARDSGSTVITLRKGKDIEQMLVTVVDEPMTIALPVTDVMVKLNETVQLEPHVNYPVGAKITWSSSAPEVADVKDGTVTGVGSGQAVITATLENGNFAAVTVDVLNPAQTLSFARENVKCKFGTVKQLGAVRTPDTSNEPLIWTSSDESIATVENGAVSGNGYGTVTITATTKYTGLMAQCQVEVCDFKQIAMTFDDGPSPNTIRLLEFLDEHNINATFFMIGNLISRYPETVKRMANDGNELGYHSYDHTYQTSISLSTVTENFLKTQDILENLTGRKATVWRAPGGYFNQDVMNAIPLPHIFWTVDTRDWETKNADSVRSAILNEAKDGAIILLHDLYSTTVDGAISAMKEMIDNGYEFLTVTQLLSRHGEAPQASVNYKIG